MTKIKIVFLMTSCKKSGPVQQMLNIIKYLDRTVFEPILVTIYTEEQTQSQLYIYEQYVRHFYVSTNKLDVLLGRDKELRRKLEELQPDIIHSLGVFPDYAVCKMGKWPQIITLRNFIYDDYPAKFGKIIGKGLSRLHLYAIRHAQKVVTCSESLAKIYGERLGLQYDYVRNGVDLGQYAKVSAEVKGKIRQELGLPENAFIFVYTGQLIERKNLHFLLRSFANAFTNKKSVYLLILGSGVQYDELVEQYKDVKNIDFRGNVLNVHQYLEGCDVYVSASKSEGLPNGVLGAMATGLPVLLSDIEQHMEIYNINHDIGCVFRQNDATELIQKMHMLMEKGTTVAGEEAYRTVTENLSAVRMSHRYQELYMQMVTSK